MASSVILADKTINPWMEADRAASPYFQPPRSQTNGPRGSEHMATSIRFMSPLAEKTDFEVIGGAGELPSIEDCATHSILEELLPTKIEAGPGRDTKTVPVSERLAATIFRVCILGYLCVGLASIALLRSDTDLLKNPTLYKALVDSTGWFCVVLLVAYAASFAMMHALSIAAQAIVYGAICLIPCGLGALAYISASWAQSGADPVLMLRGLSILFLLLAIGASVFIYKNRQKLLCTISIVRVAGKLLRSHPLVFKTSVSLQALHLGFVVFWLVAFTHLLLAAKTGWFFLGTQVLSIGLLVWTTTLLQAMQKYVVGGVISASYGKDHGDPSALAKELMRQVRNEAFGSLCLSSLLVTAVKGIRLSMCTIRSASRVAADATHLPLISWASEVFETLARSFEHATEKYTDFTVYWMAHGRESFWPASWNALRLLRRNSLLALSTDLVGSVIFTVLNAALSTAVGLLFFFYTGHALHSPYRLAVGSLFGLVAGCVIQWPLTLITSAIDATMLMYAIDVDSQKVGDAELHNAVATKLSL
jgi:hypothetical protein